MSRYFQKKKKDIDSYKRQKAKPCEWDILEKKLNKGTQKTGLSKCNFQRLKNGKFDN